MKNYKKLEQLKELVEKRTQIPDIGIKSKAGNLAVYRGMYMNCARELTPLSLARIGTYVNKDHATVLHWEKELHHVVRFNPELRELYQYIRAEARTILKGDLSYIADYYAQKVLDEMLIKC